MLTHARLTEVIRSLVLRFNASKKIFKTDKWSNQSSKTSVKVKIRDGITNW